MKTCNHCKQTKDFSAYTKAGSYEGIQRYRSKCKDCYSKLRPSRAKPKVNKLSIKDKTCIICSTTKPITEFTKYQRRGHTYFKTACRICLAAKRREKKYGTSNYHYKPVIANSNGILVKECRRCNLTKAINDFSLLHNKPRGICKSCANEKKRLSYKQNPIPYKLAAQRSYQKEPEKARSRHQRWLQKNKAHSKEYAHNYYINHTQQAKNNSKRQKESGYNRLYYILNKDKVRKRGSDWIRNNPQKNADKAARYRARKLVVSVIEVINRKEIIEREQSICYLCTYKIVNPANITIEHVVPLTRGGSHTQDNLKVAHRSCNSKKGSKLLSELSLPFDCPE